MCAAGRGRCGMTIEETAAPDFTALFGIAVRTRREQMGLLQEQVARLCDCSRPTIISIEQGKTSAGIDLALRIAKELRLSVDDIIKLGVRGD